MFVAAQVRSAFQKLPPGGVLVSAELHRLSEDSKQVDKAVSRIFREEGLKKLRNGVYYRPLTSQYLGVLPPKTQMIIQALKKQYKAIIVPSAQLAAYELGFTDDFPEERIYDTDKRIGDIEIDNVMIRFRQVVGKKLTAAGVPLATLLNAIEFFFSVHPHLNYVQRQSVLNQLGKYSQTKLVCGLATRASWLRERINDLQKIDNGPVYITGVSALNIPYQGKVGDWHQMGMLMSDKFHLAGENYRGAPNLHADELFDCQVFLNKHHIDLPTHYCATPQRAVKDILYANIIGKNRYPGFFMRNEFLLTLSDKELRRCVDELRSFADADQFAMLDQWLRDNDIH